MDNVTRIHEEMGTGKFIEVGPLTWFIAVLYLLPDWQAALYEIRVFAKRLYRWTSARCENEKFRMESYKQINPICGDGSNADLWQWLWCTTAQYQAIWNGRFTERLMSERHVRQVINFPSP